MKLMIFWLALVGTASCNKLTAKIQAVVSGMSPLVWQPAIELQPICKHYEGQGGSEPRCNYSYQCSFDSGSLKGVEFH